MKSFSKWFGKHFGMFICGAVVLCEVIHRREMREWLQSLEDRTDMLFRIVKDNDQNLYEHLISELERPSKSE